MKSVKLNRGNLLMYILLGATAVGITVTGIVFGQDFVRMIPLYVSLFVMLLNSRANRLGLLLGSINSILYALIYYYYGLYGMMANALLLSFPVQLVTFIRWRKNAYKNSTKFKKLSTKMRIILGVSFVIVFAAIYSVLSIFASNYRFFDTLNSVLSTVVLGLTFFAFVEYAPINFVNQVLTIVMYIIMVIDTPEHAPYLVFQIYALICLVRTTVSVWKLYREQNSGNTEKCGDTDVIEKTDDL